MKVLFINKKQKTISWSDAIENLRSDLESLPDIQVQGFEIDTGSISTYLRNGKTLASFLDKKEFDVILVHHVICAWPIISAIKNHRALKLLALHEGEPVLGYSFLFKNIFRIPVKQWIRFSRIWNSNPIRFFDRVLILSQQQALFRNHKKKYHQLDFLGIDGEHFVEGNLKDAPMKGVFPFGTDRIEKGYNIASKAIEDQDFEVSLNCAGDIPYSKMPSFYQNSHFLILPTFIETYSLVLLEGMASNIFILASRSIGLIDNLLLKYSLEDLESYGILVCDRNIYSFSMAIKKVRKFIQEGLKPRTRELFLLERLNRQGAAQKLSDVLFSLKENYEVD